MTLSRPAGRDTFLPFARPALGEEEIAEVVDTLRSGWLTTGPKVERFRAAVAAYVGAPHAVALSSATAGLHVALLAHGIGPGDEVVTSAMTFVATLNVIALVGATPVLADIDPGTQQVRVEELERRIGARTKALLPVHFGGQPSDMDAIIGLAERHHLVVIEDAAHAIGTEYRGRRIGSFPTTAVFSFHPNKNITSGEGGVLVTPDEDLAARAALYAFHGMDRDAWRRFDRAGSPRYDVTVVGLKYNMMDIQAAIGLHQLPRLDGHIAARERLARAYDDAFRDLAGLFLPRRVPYAMRHAWHLYTPLVDLEALRIDRDAFVRELKARNIGAGVHYTAPHEFTVYRERYGWRPDDYPDAHFVSERTLSLPLHPGLSDADQADVTEAVRDICRTFAR